MGSSGGFLRAVLKVVAGIFEMVINLCFRLVYGKKGDTMPPIRNLVLLESATSLAYKIRTGKLKSADVLESFIERINEVNPMLNCMVANRFEDARKEAKAVDELIKSGSIAEETLAKEKPFLGVPFTTKDCIAVKGLIHSAGLYKRKDIIAEEDADIIQLLKNAGAIPIALTNVSELCMWYESSNPVHGTTNNPYDTTKIVGGSSGGEACVQATAASAFGIGTDLGGSVRMPAFFCGVFGHKPSPHVVSNNGMHPMPASQQAAYNGVGPIARKAEDLKTILKVIAGKKADELKLDEPVDVKKIRFFYQDSDTGSMLCSPVQDEIKQLFPKIVKYLQDSYDIKSEQIRIKRFARSFIVWANCLLVENSTVGQMYENMQGDINIPLEFLKWCFGRSHHTIIPLMECLFEKFSPKVNSPENKEYHREKEEFISEISDLLGNDGVLLYPTHPIAAPYHSQTVFKPCNLAYTGIVNVLQLPSTHVPMGFNKDGLPIGVQVIANNKCDRLCLAVAEELEKGFGGWIPIRSES